MTSSDPPFLTPETKYMLRRKNKLMRAGRVEEAGALATKVQHAIAKANSVELREVNVQ